MLDAISVFAVAFSGGPDRLPAAAAPELRYGYDSLSSSFMGDYEPPMTSPPIAIAFNASFGSHMVLQQSPAHACIYGMLGLGGTAASIKLTPADDEAVGIEIQATVSGGGWKACLPPQPAGGDWTVSASCTGCTNTSIASLDHVTFGDVWYCGGQSNMALPLVHTLSRNLSRDAIRSGKYSTIRIHGISGNMNPSQPWSTLATALASDEDPDKSLLMSYSSTCYYFGESLVDELVKAGKAVPPIGLIHTAWGGSTIEQWLDNHTLRGCANTSLSHDNGKWHKSRVLPYASMTLKGWVWYQGENDMHGFFGSSMRHTGYACMMPALVSSWRSLWSIEAGTTDAMAPFGLVTLAPSGTEGGNDIGTMRWAQTASYGYLPNPAMPNTFLAQAFDLNDPFSNISCYHITGCPVKPMPAGGWGGCQQYCDSLAGTNYYMGPIHPRDKKPVGTRLAKSGVVAAYGVLGHSNGPTLSGCSMDGSRLTLTFNATLLAEGGGDRLQLQPYDRASGASKLHVLVNASLFCLQATGRGDATCIDNGEGVPGNGLGTKTAWVAVDMTLGSANTLEVDLTNSAGVAHAIRYAWQGDCCSENPPSDGPCPLASCPIMGGVSGLPANPFIAKIVHGKCECVAPQQCDE